MHVIILNRISTNDLPNHTRQHSDVYGEQIRDSLANMRQNGIREVLLSSVGAKPELHIAPDSSRKENVLAGT